MKLDLEKTRLLVWGNAAGILEEFGDGRSPLLQDEHMLDSLNKILEQIELLFTGTEELQQRYGFQPARDTTTEVQPDEVFVSPRSMDAFRRSYRKFFSRFKPNRTRPNMASKTRWAIRDKDSFEVMIGHIRDFVDGLNKLLPFSVDLQDRILEHEINALGISRDLERLRLLESAFAVFYPAWSSRASAIIEASEDGTNYRRIEDWISQAEVQKPSYPPDQISQPTRSLPTIKPETCKSTSCVVVLEYCSFESTVRLPQNAKSFLVVTRQCRKTIQGETSCGGLRRSIPVEEKKLESLSKDPWNIGLRISREINYRPFQEVSRPDSKRWRYYDTHFLTKALIYIYCSLCVHQIEVALAICCGNGIYENARFVIRIDDRLPSSCEPYPLAKSMESLLQRFRAWPASVLRHFDLPFLEQRIYQLESSQGAQLQSELDRDSGHHVKLIFDECISEGDLNLPCAAVVILTEPSACSETLERPPFPRDSRKPRETDIFEMTKSNKNGTISWTRRYLGAYSTVPYLKTPLDAPAPRQLSPPVSHRSKRSRQSYSASGSAIHRNPNDEEQGEEESELDWDE